MRFRVWRKIVEDIKRIYLLRIRFRRSYSEKLYYKLVITKE